MRFANLRTAVVAVFLWSTGSPLFGQTVPGPVSKTANGGVWSDVAEQTVTSRLARLTGSVTRVRDIVPRKYRTLQLNKGALQTALASAKLETAGSMSKTGVEFQLPHPSSGFQRFLIQESPIMEPDLAARFPELKTYVGRGVEDPTATVRIDIGPRGFHAIILSAGGQIYIDPYSRETDTDYISYFKTDFVANKALSCQTDEQLGAAVALAGPAAAARSSGATLRTYRLALACTGEYAAAVCSPNAPTVLNTLAAMVTSVNRISAIYERELAVRLVLVANDDKLIYLDAVSDPYSNTSGSTMLAQNQSNTDTVIGSGNYDVGHVFSTGGGGIASVGVVCVSGMKARGVSGAPNPVGDPFDVDYAAHELGHQFGAHHPFDGNGGYCSGNASVATAYEPGSGSTVMAYAGICAPQNLAPHSDDYFHTINYDEISNLVSSTSGSCAQTSATGNTPPTLGPLSAYTIPAQTPFVLTALADDVDGDQLTYCWEEFDRGSLQDPTVDPRDNGSSPLFRSYPPVTTPARYFPSLPYILNNQNVAPPIISNYATGEFLPTTSRTMNFRVTVRDNEPIGGVTYGSTTVTSVASAGPFAVTSPNTGLTINGGSQLTVTWKVANTNIAPINCASVKISLSTDGGNTFPIVLAGGVPNNGSATVTIPDTANVATIQGRIKVEAVGNIFFDISDANLTITSSNAPPILNIVNGIYVPRGKPTPTLAAVGTATDADGNPVTVSVSDVPAGAEVASWMNNGSIWLSATVDCDLVTTLSLRTYPITVTVTDSNGSTASAKANLIVTPNAAPTLGTYYDTLVGTNRTTISSPDTPAADVNDNLGPSPYSVSPATLPGGGTVSVNQSTGVVTIVPTASTTIGVVSIRVTVTDLCGAAVVRTFSVQIVPAGVPSLQAVNVVEPAIEACSPANGAIDPGETVTVNFPITNTGTADTVNLIATLQATGGITPVTTTQSYGLIPVGSTVAAPFEFTANGTCGGTATATLTLQDGPDSYASLTYTIRLGAPIPVFTEGFDGVTAPALPAGWTTAVASGAVSPWVTDFAAPYSAPNAISATTGASTSDNQLMSPVLNVPSTAAQLTFRHRWNLEDGYDGGILEIAINGGAFTDIVTAGGSFVTGGYTGTINTGTGSPIQGASAWTGRMNGSYTITQINLPAAALGKPVRFRWRLTSDASFSETPSIWRIDNVVLTGNSYSCMSCPTAPAITSGPPPPVVVVGTPYSFTFTTSGNPAPAFTLQGGTLPPGLTLSPNGVLSGTVGAAGSSYPNIVVTASNGNPPAAQSAFSLTTVTRAANYLSGFGLSGGNADLLYDYDRDGLSNLAEYALSLNPTVADVQSGPVIAVNKFSGVEYLAVTFHRSAAATDITYVVQVSDDLMAWTDLASSSAGAPMSGPGFVSETGVAPDLLVTVRDTVPYTRTAAQHRFMRLKISSP